MVRDFRYTHFETLIDVYKLNLQTFKCAYFRRSPPKSVISSLKNRLGETPRMTLQLLIEFALFNQ